MGALSSAGKELLFLYKVNKGQLGLEGTSGDQLVQAMCSEHGQLKLLRVMFYWDCVSVIMESIYNLSAYSSVNLPWE